MDERERRRASLIEFLEAARTQGVSDEMLANLLERRGWSRKDIYNAFGTLYERLTGLELPGRAAKSTESARDAFLYLLSFGTLATWAGGLRSLIFTVIDARLPTTMPQYRNLTMALSGSLAGIIVAFPIYLLTMRFLLRGVQAQPEKLESGVRKWLTYIALLLASATVIGDLVTLLTYLFRGDVTIRFVLKVLTVLIMAGGIFWYYLRWLERPAERRTE